MGIDSFGSRSNRVGVATGAPLYPTNPPFHPSERYPEYPFGECDQEPNGAYAVVRDALYLAGLDHGAFGTPRWNPLAGIVRPGDTVLLKPNLIRESHPYRSEWQQVITNGSIIRAVLDYVFLASNGRGRAIVADGPQTDSDFEAIRRAVGLDAIAGHFRAKGYAVDVLDLRRDRWFQQGDVISRRESLPGDPAGYVSVDLGRHSAFEGRTLTGPFYGADYDTRETAAFHADGRHTYVLCRSAMAADAVVNLPKLKTHKKTGVTLSLKNFVGINGYRNCLPHHTRGTPQDGGDEFPVNDAALRLQGKGIQMFRRLLVARGGTGGAWMRGVKRLGRGIFGDTEHVVRSGNWVGNDTAWRMVLDLNRAFFHFDAAGGPRQAPARYFTLIDGIIAGDGNGPTAPDAAPCGVVLAGASPAAVDLVAATIMGFDYRRLPVVREAWMPHDLPLFSGRVEDVECCSSRPEWTGGLEQLMRARSLGFRPHFAWAGAIERQPTPHGSASAGSHGSS